MRRDTINPCSIDGPSLQIGRLESVRLLDVYPITQGRFQLGLG